MTRTEARKAALDLLFEREFKLDEMNEEIFALSCENREIADDDYLKRAYFAITGNIEKIDATIGEHAHGWKTSRLGRVSRAVLRMGVYELLFEADIPSSVTINEAVELTKKLDDEKARPFVNGVLNSVKDSVGEKN